MDERLLAIDAILNRNKFHSECYDTPQQAAAALLELIGAGESVGFGGSVTLEDMGLYDALRDRGNSVCWHWRSDDPARAREQAGQADWYLSSSNAVTENGEFVNIDGTGNRVANIAYGSSKLALVVGRNKLCGSYEEAMERIKTVACPKNATRLSLKTPCAITGKCNDCRSPQRMCNFTCILQRPTGGREVHVLLVDADLGY